jgi:hypothetical protein
VVAYNAELRDQNTSRLIGIIDLFLDKNGKMKDSKVRHCENCSQYGYEHPLGIYLIRPNEKLPDNYNDLLMCWECGNKYGRFEMIAKALRNKNKNRNRRMRE